MLTYPYKQSDDLTNTYDKKNIESRVNTKIHVKTVCGNKPQAAVSNPLYEEAIQEGGSDQGWGGFKSSTDFISIGLIWWI